MACSKKTLLNTQKKQDLFQAMYRGAQEMHKTVLFAFVRMQYVQNGGNDWSNNQEKLYIRTTKQNDETFMKSGCGVPTINNVWSICNENDLVCNLD